MVRVVQGLSLCLMVKGKLWRGVLAPHWLGKGERPYMAKHGVMDLVVYFFLLHLLSSKLPSIHIFVFLSDTISYV